MAKQTRSLTPDEARAVFLSLAASGIGRITLSRPRGVRSGSCDGGALPDRVGGRVFAGKEGPVLQWERRAPDGKVFHQNLPIEAAADDFLRLLAEEYQQANIAADDDHEVLSAQPGNLRWITRPRGGSAPSRPQAHDREKAFAYPEGTPVPFLAALGIMDEKGRVFPRAYDKFRQINKFIEMFGPAAQRLAGEGPLHMVDLCCGKGYLTFALYDHVTRHMGREAAMSGVDRKADVVAAANAAASRLGYSGCSFIQGDIGDYRPDGPVDVVLSLHACDTATDVALAQAVRWGARAILSSPCCHHELAAQIDEKALPLVLGQPILRQRYAEMLTDAARAEALRVMGYEVAIMEFIDMEHTQKNLLIRAMRTGKPSASRAALEAELARHGVRSTLLKLLDEG